MSPDKARERQIIEGVVRAGLLPQGEVHESESPDFTLVTPNEEIGIEVTEYNTSEKERESTERFERHLLPKMLERLRDVGGQEYDYLWGIIYPAKQKFFPSPRREDEFITEWANAMRLLQNAK